MQFIRCSCKSSFGTVCMALHIFCTLPVTVAGGKRAFSNPKKRLRKKDIWGPLCPTTGFAVLLCCSLKYSWRDSRTSKTWSMTLLARGLGAGLLVSLAEKGPVITVRWHAYWYYCRHGKLRKDWAQEICHRNSWIAMNRVVHNEDTVIVALLFE